MTRKVHIALAAALALPALPALGYQEEFTTLGRQDERPTAVQMAGHYSEGYVLEEPVAVRPQAAPVVVGNYTESFFEPGAPARAASAQGRPAKAKARVAAKE
jgi:hypothetical protein